MLLPKVSLREERERTIGLLADEYPATFFIVPQKRRPLTKTIEADLLNELEKDRESPLHDVDVGDALSWYRSHVGYLKVCSVAGASRIDLRGNVVAKVTPAEAEAARKEAQSVFDDIEARKKSLPPPTFLVPVPAPAPRPTALSVDTSLSALDMLNRMKVRLDLVASVLGDDQDPIRFQMARPVLQLMADEIHAVIARGDRGGAP
jgi:hypothetical protein